MKRISTLLFVLLLSHFSQSQYAAGRINVDQFKKYSYLVISYPSGPELQKNFLTGTGFFVRKSDKLFFVSNYHLITGIDGWMNAISDYDSLKIRYYDRAEGAHYLTINLLAIKEKREKCDFVISPDIYVLQIKEIPKDAIIYSLDAIIDAKPKAFKRRDAISFQFSRIPGDDIEHQVLEIKRHDEILANSPNFSSSINSGNGSVNNPLPISKPAAMADRINFDHLQPLFYSGNFVDPFQHYLKKFNDELYWLSVPGTYDGASGSPVFWLCEKKAKGKKRTWVEFAGVQSGTDEKMKVCVIVKSDILRAKLKEAFDRDSFADYRKVISVERN